MTSGNVSVALVADICRRMLTLVLAVFYHRITRYFASVMAAIGLLDVAILPLMVSGMGGVAGEY